MTGELLTRLRRRFTVPLALLLGLNAVVFLAYSLPRMLQERSLAEQARALEADLARDKRALARLLEREAVVRANGQDLEAFYRDVLMDDAERVQVLKDLDSAASSTGNRSYAKSVVKGTAAHRLAVTMPVQGSYERLVAFLHAIERSPHFVTVDRISLREREASAELMVEVSAYFRGEREEPLEKDKRG